MRKFYATFNCTSLRDGQSISLPSILSVQPKGPKKTLRVPNGPDKIGVGPGCGVPNLRCFVRGPKMVPKASRGPGDAHMGKDLKTDHFFVKMFGFEGGC